MHLSYANYFWVLHQYSRVKKRIFHFEESWKLCFGYVDFLHNNLVRIKKTPTKDFEIKNLIFCFEETCKFYFGKVDSLHNNCENKNNSNQRTLKLNEKQNAKLSNFI